MGRTYSDDEEANLRDEMNEDASDEEEEEHPDDEMDDIYGPDGEVIYSPWYEAQKVERKCQGCCSIFMGMPDHGYCDRCADIIERGGEYPVCEEHDEESMEDHLKQKYGGSDL